MTRIEKELVISALSEYANKQCKQADKERKQGENGKAAKCESEYCMANGLMMTFCKILTEPCGSCSI